jgi:sugar-specific transcriptional regulator TrmB
MLDDVLRENGLTSKEVSVYLAALELGEGTVAAVAARAHLQRTTVYSLIPDMVRRGLLSTAKRRGIVKLSALPPGVLVDRFKRASRLAESALPELLALADTSPLKPRLRVYEGLEGIRSVLTEFGDSTEPTMGFTDYASMPREMLSFIRQEVVTLRRKRGNPVRLIAPRNATNERVQAQDHKAYGEHRLLDIAMTDPGIELLLYDGRRVAFLSFVRTDTFAAVLESKAAHNMLVAIFDALWNVARRAK